MRKLSHGLIAVSLLAAWAIISLWAPASALKVAVSSAFLLMMPGYLIMQLVIKDDRKRNFWASLAYAVALSVLFLMLLGLAMSVLLPLVGIAHPLTTGPLVVAITGGVAALIGAVLRRRGGIFFDELRVMGGVQSWILALLGAMLPILAIAGAVMLNNGASGRITLLMMSLVAVYALWLIWPRRQAMYQMYPYALFMMAAALLLATSMRGWFITGHDIIQEYQVFQLTAQHGVWSMSFLRDAYNACLSITILPTVLARLTGLSDPYVYKLLFQLVFALVPPLLYLTLARFLPRRAAFLAAFVFVTFPTFLTDMPMLGRQEMAFLFFALALMTLFDVRLARRAKSVMVLLLGLGMILSHYSTSYVAMGVILAAKVLELAVLRWDRWRQHKPAPRIVSMPLSWPVVLALGLTVYLWNSQITSTSQGIASTIGGITTSLPKLFGHSTQTGEASYSIVGHKLTQEQIFQQYTMNVTKARDLEASAYYPATVINQYPIQQAQEQVDAPTRSGQWLSRLGVRLYDLYDAMRSGYAKLIQVLILLGLAALMLRPRLARIPRQYLLLGVSSLAMIVLEVLLPSVINYGLLRLIQQSLLFLAPAIVIACYVIFGWLRFPPHWRVRATALLFVGFFLVNAGLLPAITGGYKPSLTTSNSGVYYAAYYTHADELAGYQWLAAHVPKGAVVNADEFARRKMITYAGIYARGSLAPANISKDAYVYLSYGNVAFNQVPFYYNGTLLYEQPPLQFLNDHKNLVYSNGDVRIYQ
jgi:uncharacterized membrane protein